MKFGSASGWLRAEFNPFADEYLGEILEAVAMAWARMKQPTSGEIEIRITRLLAARLRHDPLFRNLPFDVTQEYIIDDLDAQYLGRLDLHIKYRQSQRDYFALEAKRLHVSYGGTLSTEYVTYLGAEGLGGYIQGPYSENLPAAGMLGYVMDANTERAWLGLKAKIAAKRDELRMSSDSLLVQSPLSSKVVQNGLIGTMLGETLHNWKQRNLRMFHLLLPVNGKSN